MTVMSPRWKAIDEAGVPPRPRDIDEFLSAWVDRHGYARRLEGQWRVYHDGQRFVWEKVA